MECLISKIWMLDKKNQHLQNDHNLLPIYCHIPVFESSRRPSAALLVWSVSGVTPAPNSVAGFFLSCSDFLGLPLPLLPYNQIDRMKSHQISRIKIEYSSNVYMNIPFMRKWIFIKVNNTRLKISDFKTLWIFTINCIFFKSGQVQGTMSFEEVW